MASPLLGYNTNVRHHGKLFHIQTEDSGRQHAHIFTHLFADGGRIIATKKTSYAAWLSSDRFAETVKKLMQAQHKAMFIALRDGLFDQDEAAGARAFAERPIALEDGQVAPPAPARATATSASATFPAPTKSAAPIPARDEALERAASAYSKPVSKRPPVTAPPPAAAPNRPRLEPAPAALQEATAQAARYVSTQPAGTRARPSTAPKLPQVDSLFGGDILSEKSLDEVIMSYLAEDLDEKE